MSSPYPIKVRKLTLACKNARSDKEYHLVQIICENDRSVLIKRYNRRGATGKIEFENGTIAKMNAAFTRKEREKRGKGYEQQNNTLKTADTYKELEDQLGALYARQLAAQPDLVGWISGLTADADKAPATDEAAQALDDIDEIVSTARRTGVLPPEAQTPKTEAERYAKNSLYGAFS